MEGWEMLGLLLIGAGLLAGAEHYWTLYRRRKRVADADNPEAAARAVGRVLAEHRRRAAEREDTMREVMYDDSPRGAKVPPGECGGLEIAATYFDECAELTPLDVAKLAEAVLAHLSGLPYDSEWVREANRQHAREVEDVCSGCGGKRINGRCGLCVE